MPDIDHVLRENLTLRQYNAAIDSAQEVLCLACAGSGKSRTLGFRIARLLAEGEDPKSIVAFTFTKKAAETIKRRVADALLRSGLDPSGLGAIYVGTTHSFCEHLLEAADAKYRQYETLDDNRLLLYLLSRYYPFGLNTLAAERRVGQFRCIREVAAAWKTLNNEVLETSDVGDLDYTLGTVLQDLKDGLIDNEYYDFSLMIRLVTDKLANNDASIVSAIQGVRHLLVDEYQDINPAQEVLIRGIHENGASLFVVGDDDQAVHAWRGADVGNILNFDTRYPSYSERELSTNFRSVPPIVDVSANFIAQRLDPNRKTKHPRHDESNENKPYHLGALWFANRAEEAEWVASRIKHLLGKSFEENDLNVGTRGLCQSDFAILMQSTNSKENDRITPRHAAFTSALDQLGIHYTIEAQESIFQSPLANTLREVFELLRNSSLNRPTLQQYFESSILPCFPNADLTEVGRVLNRWLILIHQPIAAGRRKISPQELLYDLLDAFHVKDTNFDDIELQVLGVYSKIMEDVEAVYVSVDTTGRFRQVLNYLQNVATDGYELSPDEVLQRPNAVFVSTIHKAKGLEFPVVFVVDAEQGRLPGSTGKYRGWLPANLMASAKAAGRYQNDNAGDARVFYTAITRAERYLYITGCEFLPGGVQKRKPSVLTQTLRHDEITNDRSELPQHISDVAPEQCVQRIDETVMPTTYSDIRYYLMCPKNYQFRNQYGFRSPVPDLYGFGQTTHAAIGKLHQAFASLAPTMEEAESTVRQTFNLKHVPQSNNPETSPGPYERAQEKAVQVVREYVDNYHEDFANERQVEARFEIPAEKAIITGSIDLLLREDNEGRIVEAKVIDFKTMNEPGDANVLDWTNLSLQVQLYAKAANEVLGENARTGAVHLLRDNVRASVPVSIEAIDAAISNIEWSVERIIQRDYPMRPHPGKCAECDFKVLCPKIPEEFKDTTTPSPVHVPTIVSDTPIMVKAFSEFNG